MSVFQVVCAAVIAGICMALATEAGYRIGIIRGNLIHVDGEFALKRMGRELSPGLVYLVGAVTHLVASAAFGLVLWIIAEVIDVEANSVGLLAAYVFLLWLAMMFAALPVAGQGVLGRRLAGSVWIEQFFLHIVFFFGMWAMLNID